MRYKPTAGEHIEHTAKNMAALAIVGKETIEANFNDIELVANPGTTIEQVMSQYDKACEKRHEEAERKHAEFLKTPEGKEWAIKVAEAKKKEEEAIAAGVLPITTKDAEAAAGWKKTIEVNNDGYGACGVRYAARWANLMEQKIAAGAKLEEIADAMSSEADVEGITGFMYGCAVGILSKVWIHGEELRRWHNLATQIGNEGEKANESGGVLNPALLNIEPKE